MCPSIHYPEGKPILFFFPARKTGVCYRYGAGVALGSQTEHSCLVHLIITPCISCLPYAREPEAHPLGWLALKNYVLPLNLPLISTKLRLGLQSRHRNSNSTLRPPPWQSGYAFRLVNG